jgi:hydroxyacylglutathione hydrolase
VLGTHIEQTKTSYLDYPRGTTYQPEEHSLELTRANVIELNEAFISIKANPEKTALSEITITTRAANAAGRAAPAATPAPK